LGLVTGGKAKQFMTTKIKYTNEPIEAKVIMDFLPPPEELAFREEGVKVTIALSKKSVDFFKSEASKHHTQYQRMIRNLIDTYVETYAEPLARRSSASPLSSTSHTRGYMTTHRAFSITFSFAAFLEVLNWFLPWAHGAFLQRRYAFLTMVATHDCA